MSGHPSLCFETLEVWRKGASWGRRRPFALTLAGTRSLAELLQLASLEPLSQRIDLRSRLHLACEGIPRKINRLATLTLMAAAVQKRHVIDDGFLDQVASAEFSWTA